MHTHSVAKDTASRHTTTVKSCCCCLVCVCVSCVFGWARCGDEKRRQNGRVCTSVVRELLREQRPDSRQTHEWRPFPIQRATLGNDGRDDIWRPSNQTLENTPYHSRRDLGRIHARHTHTHWHCQIHGREKKSFSIGTLLLDTRIAAGKRKKYIISIRTQLGKNVRRLLREATEPWSVQLGRGRVMKSYFFAIIKSLSLFLVLFHLDNAKREREREGWAKIQISFYSFSCVVHGAVFKRTGVHGPENGLRLQPLFFHVPLLLYIHRVFFQFPKTFFLLFGAERSCGLPRSRLSFINRKLFYRIKKNKKFTFLRRRRPSVAGGTGQDKTVAVNKFSQSSIRNE